MADYNVSVTMSSEPAPTDISAGSSTTYIIDNPLTGSSYFGLETVPNSDGKYDSTTPKNCEGTYTLGSGLTSLIHDDYKAGVVVSPGGGSLTFVPDNTIISSSLRLRGTGDGYADVSSLPTFMGILDDYPGASAAFSIRRLSSEYEGAALQVRRDIDNAVQDIEFDSEGNLDTAALLSFVGTGGTDNGYVRTWYDQSGNGNDVIQTSVANQPQIVSGGSVILTNNTSSIQFNGSTTALTVSANGNGFINGPSFASTVSTSNNLSGTNDQSIFSWSGDSMNVFTMGYDLNSSKAAIYDAGYQFNPTHSAIVSTQYLHILDYDGSTNFDFYQNNATSTGNQNPATDLTGTTLALGSGTSGAGSIWKLNGTLQEVIIYESDQSSNRTDIQTNVNEYFNIYP